jgi:hypothetical protein
VPDGVASVLVGGVEGSPGVLVMCRSWIRFPQGSRTHDYEVPCEAGQLAPAARSQTASIKTLAPAWARLTSRPAGGSHVSGAPGRIRTCAVIMSSCRRRGGFDV